MTFEPGDIVCQVDQPWRVFVVIYPAHGSYGVWNAQTGETHKSFLVSGRKLMLTAPNRELPDEVHRVAAKIKLLGVT